MLSSLWSWYCLRGSYAYEQAREQVFPRGDKGRALARDLLLFAIGSVIYYCWRGPDAVTEAIIQSLSFGVLAVLAYAVLVTAFSWIVSPFVLWRRANSERDEARGSIETQRSASETQKLLMDLLAQRETMVTYRSRFDRVMTTGAVSDLKIEWEGFRTQISNRLKQDNRDAWRSHWGPPDDWTRSGETYLDFWARHLAKLDFIIAELQRERAKQ